MDRIGSNGRSEKFENAADADKRTSSATATADAPLTVCSPSVLVRDWSHEQKDPVDEATLRAFTPSTFATERARERECDAVRFGGRETERVRASSGRVR